MAASTSLILALWMLAELGCYGLGRFRCSSSMFHMQEKLLKRVVIFCELSWLSAFRVQVQQVVSCSLNPVAYPTSVALVAFRPLGS